MIMQHKSMRLLKLLLLSGILTASILFVNIPVFAEPQGSGFSETPTFQDEFNSSSLDTSKWDYREGARIDGYNLSNNVSVSDGYLNIALKQESYGGKNYTCGGVISKSPNIFKYGYYETRAKLTDKPGWHSAFWLMGTNGVQQVNEIDGFECDSHVPTCFTTCAHYYAPSHVNYGQVSHNIINTATDFHVYGWEWTPIEIRFYVDGTLIRKLNYPGPHSAQNVWLTGLAYDVGHGIQGDTSISFDYFRYYAKDYGTGARDNAIIVDNGDTNYIETGTWSDETIACGFANTNTRQSTSVGSTSEWIPNIPSAGLYNVYVWNPSIYNAYTNNANYTVNFNGGSVNVDINQQLAGQSWVKLGRFNFAVGTGGNVILTAQSGTTRADAVMFEPAPDIIIDNGGDGYTEETGTWNDSSLLGYNNSSTRYAYGNAESASVKWTPELAAGDYRVYIYMVVNANSDPNAEIEICHSGGTTIQYLDYSTGQSGWVDLGVFNFSAGEAGHVKNTLNTNNKCARADAVKFVPVTTVVIDNGEAGYTESGTWNNSTLIGYEGSDTRYAAGSAYSQWMPGLLEGKYRVYIYKVVYSGSDPNAKIDIIHSNVTTTQYLNYLTGSSGWVDLGVFNFSMGENIYVRNTLNTSNTITRADAVKFVPE